MECDELALLGMIKFDEIAMISVYASFLNF